MTVAALYVDPAGVYANLPGVEVWDEARDARTYAGPWPVVAHPPCNRWSLMANCNPHVRHLLGQDGGCFAAAVDAVRTFGGVLEHPAHSAAWSHFSLPRPSTRGGWTRSLLDDGWACMVDQAACLRPRGTETDVALCLRLRTARARLARVEATEHERAVARQRSLKPDPARVP